MQDNNVETNIRDPYTGNPLTNIVDASASQLPELTREEGEYRKVASVADGLANIYKQVVDSASNGMGITPEEASDVNVAVTTMADSIGLECRMPSMESFHEGVMGRTIGTTLTIESIGETISNVAKRLLEIIMRLGEKLKLFFQDKSRAIRARIKMVREKLSGRNGEINLTIPLTNQMFILVNPSTGKLFGNDLSSSLKTYNKILTQIFKVHGNVLSSLDHNVLGPKQIDSDELLANLRSITGVKNNSGGEISVTDNLIINALFPEKGPGGVSGQFVYSLGFKSIDVNTGTVEVNFRPKTANEFLTYSESLLDSASSTVKEHFALVRAFCEKAKGGMNDGKGNNESNMLALTVAKGTITSVQDSSHTIMTFIDAATSLYNTARIEYDKRNSELSKEEMDEPEDDNYLGDAGDADLTNGSEVLSPDDTLALEQLHEAADKLVDLQYRFEDRYSEGNKFSMEEHFDIQSEVRAIRVSLGMSTEDLTFENLYTEEDVKESQWKTISKTLLDIFKRIIAMAKRLFNKAADWFDQAMHSKVGKNIRHIVSILGKIGRAGIAGGLSIKFKPAYAGLVIDDRITSNIGDDLNALFMANLDVLDAANSDITGTSDMVTEIGKIIQEGHDKYNTTAGSTGTGVSIPVAGGGEYTASPEAIGIAKRISGKFKNKHKTVIPLSKSRKQKTTVYTYSKPLIGNSILLSITDDTNPLANIANRGIVLAEIEKLEEMFEFDTGFNIKGTDSVLARFDKQVTVDILNYGNINSAMERVQTLALTREEMMDKISKHMSELNALFTKIERGLEKINIDASYGEAVALVLRITTDTVRRQTNLTRASESALVKPVDSFTVFVADANAELARRTNQ